MKDTPNSSSETEDKSFPSKITLQIKGKLILLDDPCVMGILNVTPDSFYSESRISTLGNQLLQKAEQLLGEGAAILDLGGYSSRPGAAEVTTEDEISRIVPAVKALKDRFPEAIISVDTFRHEVAEAAFAEGADIINDISGGELDKKMIPTVGKLKIPYICMHMRGNPATMQGKTEYNNLEKDILLFFNEKLNQCHKAGIKDVIIDPGFGFAKSLAQNYRILKNLSYFKTIKSPILAGVSRKSMIYKTLGISPEEALNGTTALNMAALLNGAKILRVHDVKEATETVKLYKQLYP
ncbi:dihydropteroate synthase [Echinicola vietnamensis]|uniref:dihydropteroate synthase n=1 Tax=Echinicola vietnamensis (strain DSM 17526 / LMG 23754 / KMM 6221) TaxID=926556 RepID=L0FUT3_ECHVK|nr:dihydropteroate synthase [Echinicola vietnamensis]AGA76440.1 dihydropteroate synthase [Echinicola vietnamensis DSM 17526]